MINEIDESLIIIDNETRHVVFANKNAKKLSATCGRSINLSMPHEDERGASSEVNHED